MATNILIESIDASGKKIQKAVTNVNPTASNSDLKDFAESLNALTGNTYVGTVKVDREDITTAAAKTPITFRDGQAPPASLSWSTIVSEMTSTGMYSDMYYISSYDSTTRPPEFQRTVPLNCNINDIGGAGVRADIHFEMITFYLFSDKEYEPSDDFDVNLFIPETATTAATTVTIHITKN